MSRLLRWLILLSFALTGSQPALAMSPDPGPGQRHRVLSPRVIQVEAKARWAHIVQGESGGGWLEGSRLVAWTLRAWELERGMPAENAGRDWGWHGWYDGVPGYEARGVVDEVWGQPLSASPFGFMRDGNYCMALGSARDSVYWKSIGWYADPDFVIVHPTHPTYSMNCYFRPAGGS